MHRLEAFSGFVIKRTVAKELFNPFLADIRAEPVRTHDVLESIAKGNAVAEERMKNVLGAEDTAPEEPMVLFPKPKEAEAVVPPEEASVVVPMIQPRSKEGQRLLYQHPNLPRVGVKGAYWLLVGQSDRSQAAWLLQFDGGANPNPGPASSGAVLWGPPGIDGSRSVVYEVGKYLGRATNNIAEAQGLLLGLKIAAARGARELLIEGDSELIVFQQTGKYRVKDRNLKVWWSEIHAAMMDETCFDWIAIRQVPRELNERADSITKEVLIRKEGFTRA
jgi:ribonuclease HI